MSKRKRQPEQPLYVVGEGMCGLCVHWIGDVGAMDAFGNCGMAAVDFRNGERKYAAALPELVLGDGLRQQVYDRERAAREERDQLVEQRPPRMVRIEAVSHLPMTRGGAPQWEHMRTRAWGGCDRYQRRSGIEAEPTPMRQMALMEVS